MWKGAARLFFQGFLYFVLSRKSPLSSETSEVISQMEAINWYYTAKDFSIPFYINLISLSAFKSDAYHIPFQCSLFPFHQAATKDVVTTF